METKICSKCNAEKSCSEFSIRNDIKGIGYRKTCKECESERRKKRYSDNLEKELEKAKFYREKNPDYKKNYNTKNPNYNKNYYLKNSDRIKLQSKLSIKERRKNNLLFKLESNIRAFIGVTLKRKKYTKKSRTYQLLGCTYDEFKLYIESKFEPWMNWDNYGNWNGQPTELNTAWDLDHIIPISSATTEDELLKLFHYTNLQPLCSYTNRFIKRDN